MNRLAIVTQRHLGKVFRISSRFGPLGPSIAVRMKRNPWHVNTAAGPLKQARPVLLIHVGQAREKQASSG